MGIAERTRVVVRCPNGPCAGELYYVAHTALTGPGTGLAGVAPSGKSCGCLLTPGQARAALIQAATRSLGEPIEEEPEGAGAADER